MKKILMAVALALPLFARTVDGTPEVTVLVGGVPREEYVHRGTTYIEAVRGREFTIRLRNPTAQRVAVALSVDGLNTIDAKHSDAWSASKWVLEPYETAEISGWQVSDRAARRFFFTGERNSYGARLGQTQNLGIIEAVFYRERVPRWSERQKSSRDQGGLEGGAPPPSASAAPRAEESAPDDDYAATGMGRRTRHEVEEVAIDLERSPIAAVAIRYEFRPQLAKLGVLDRDPLERRERARGFCPEP
ncbi:MAG TPA: hypothetical protein VF432_11435 [Thermoanaerobaculia bacterium]